MYEYTYSFKEKIVMVNAHASKIYGITVLRAFYSQQNGKSMSLMTAKVQVEAMMMEPLEVYLDQYECMSGVKTRKADFFPV